MTYTTIKDVIEYCQNIKANSFSNKTLLTWINDLEGRIQTDVMLLAAPEVKDYIWESDAHVRGIYFPDSKTMKLPHAINIRPGGKLIIGELENYPNNSGSAIIKSVSEDGLTVCFEDGTFTDTGTTPESGNTELGFDGSVTELLLPYPWHRCYRSWLLAKISEHLEEAKEYNNRLNTFNDDWAEFNAWYASNYNPANGKAEFRGYYITGPAGQNGSNGITPHVGANGNWFIGDTDTGLPSRGADGPAGRDGQNGVSLSGAAIDQNGHLILSLTDGTTIDAGQADNLPSTVRFIEQSLTDAQKAQARANIGAVSAGEITAELKGTYNTATGEIIIDYPEGVEDGFRYIADLHLAGTDVRLSINGINTDWDAIFRLNKVSLEGYLVFSNMELLDDYSDNARFIVISDNAPPLYVPYEGGGSTDNTFVITGQFDGMVFSDMSATYVQILSAYNEGKVVELHLNTDEEGTEFVLPLKSVADVSGEIYFGVESAYYDYFDYGAGLYKVTCDGNNDWWFEFIEETSKAAWLPTVDANGNISWQKSETDTAPETRNITGPAGQNGSNGITPHVGANGNWYIGDTDTGLPSRGATGPAGQNGSNGQDGHTPVRGTDYWTAADIATIKGYVDDAILGGEW